MTKIKIVILNLGLLLAFISCEPKNELSTLQEELKTKKESYTNLKLEIKDLQKQIEALDTLEVISGIAVNVKKVTETHFEHFFLVNGSFEAVNYAYISPETSGQITAITVEEGEKVKKGQLLAKLNTAIIENSISEVESALSLAQVVYNKQKELWDKNIGSELDYLRAKNDVERLQNQKKTLQSQLDMAYIKSPINGIVDDITQNQGELAMPGQLLMQIVNLDHFYFNAEVSESYLPYLHPGDSVKIRLTTYDNKTIDAKIHRIANIINPENRSFKIQVKLGNKYKLLKPNMLAEARFKDYENLQALVVPSIIIKKDFNGYYLFVAKKEKETWIAKKKYIIPGKSKDDKTMIEQGISSDELVIIKGYNQVVDGSLVSIK